MLLSVATTAGDPEDAGGASEDEGAGAAAGAADGPGQASVGAGGASSFGDAPASIFAASAAGSTGITGAAGAGWVAFFESDFFVAAWREVRCVAAASADVVAGFSADCGAGV